MLSRATDFQKKYPLKKTKIVKYIINDSFWFLLLLGFGSLITFGHLIVVPSMHYVIMIALMWIFYLAMAACIVIYQLAHFKYYFYDVNEKGVVIVKGIFRRYQLFIPFEQITEVKIEQDFLDRFFDLYDVHFITTDKSKLLYAHIDGVSAESAQSIKRTILESPSKR